MICNGKNLSIYFSSKLIPLHRWSDQNTGLALALSGDLGFCPPEILFYSGSTLSYKCDNEQAA